MRKIFLLAGLVLTSFSTVQAQQKIEVSQIWNGTFRTNQLNALNTLHTKNQYSVLDFNQQSKIFTIDAYDFTTLEKVQTLFSTADHPEIQQVSDYQINKTDDKILIATDYHPIYRHSFTSVYYLYDIKTKTLTKIDRKSTRLNSSHVRISYAVFCLKKKNNIIGWACTHLFRYFSILVSPASSPTFSIRALLVLTPFARLLFLSCSQYLSRCLSQCLR